jgi:hypothetical protein
MPHAMSPGTEDTISDILNWVCPECGARMGGRTNAFKCEGRCGTDWRDVWEHGQTGKYTNPPQALGKRYKDYARTE